MGVSSRNRSRLTGVVIGLAVTALGVAGLLSGWMDAWGRASLDMHFRFSGERPADDRILLVDIDDASLDAVGDWPWPRRRYAQLIRSLARAGAQSIVLDVVLADPSAPRVTHAGLGAQYDTDDLLHVRGSRAADETVFDDDELRDAMQSAGNVYLAMYGKMAPRGPCPDSFLDRCLVWLQESLGMSLPDMHTRAATDLGDAGECSGDGVFVRALLVSQLEAAFGLSQDVAEARLAGAGVEAEAIGRAWRGAKKAAARRLAMAFLSETSGRTDVDRRWATFLTQTLGPSAVDALSPDRTVLLDAFRWARSYRAVKGFLVDAVADQGMPCVYDETFPLDKFASVARGVGFVAHARDQGDGVVRTLPLLVHGDRRWYAQLGLSCASDVLGFDRAQVGFGRIELSGGGAAQRVPINSAGESVIAWHTPGGGDWRDSFAHRSAASVLQAARAREAIEENERRIGIVMGALLSLRCQETPGEYGRYETLSNERWLLRRRELRYAQSLTSAQTKRLGQLDQQVTGMEQEALEWLQRLHRLWRDTKPETEQEQTQRDAVEALHSELVAGSLAARLETLNRASSEQGAAAEVELHGAVEGKICLVGYTASSVADLVTTPVFSSVPGVMAHANVLNMLLTGQFITVVPVMVQVLVMGVLGALLSVVTSRRAGVVSLFVLLAGVAALMVVGVWLFRTMDVQVPTVPIAIVMGCVWALVTVHRQFTEEHVRRSVERALSQYTSPAIAARVAQDANLRSLAPQPAQVTCFFSDLAGFTRLSERLGPARTRDVLNPYLRGMSAVLIEHGAIVNKFIGDGIFAFFNAPIRPCDDHERAACDAALACHEALRALNREQPEADALRMRIGIATGEVFVGDYGSDTKLDYTCIGDCVNLASRLENANKVLGTLTLTDRATAVAGDGLVRALGRWRVAGREGVVELFEIISAADRHDGAGDLPDLWTEALAHFHAQRWQTCRDAFTRHLARNPDDSIAKAYLRAVAQFEVTPPDSEWDGAIDIPMV